jgi:hypothetical protein
MVWPSWADFVIVRAALAVEEGGARDDRQPRKGRRQGSAAHDEASDSQRLWPSLVESILGLRALLDSGRASALETSLEMVARHRYGRHLFGLAVTACRSPTPDRRLRG